MDRGCPALASSMYVCVHQMLCFGQAPGRTTADAVATILSFDMSYFRILDSILQEARLAKKLTGLN